MILPILISVSVAPGSYFFCASALLLDAASIMSAAEAIASLLDATGISDLPLTYDVCPSCSFVDFEILDDVAGLNTIWRQPSTKSPGETCAGAASLVVSRADLVVSLPGPAGCQPPTSALMMSPKRSHVLPLKRISCNCDSGAKSVADVLIVTPGSRPPSSRSLMPAACFMTFSRVRSSPHCCST